jgi:hypothetical protein
MSLTEPELRLRARRLARREQVLRAREAELAVAESSPDQLGALMRELVDRAPPARVAPALGVAPGLLGLWLLASPVVLGFAAEGAAWSCIACGIVAALAAGLRLSGAAHPLASWSLVAASAWLIAFAPWLDAPARAGIACEVSGALGLAAAVAPHALREPSRRGGGARRAARDAVRLR